MKKVLLFSPTGSIHTRFNTANIKAIDELGYELHLLANFENGPGPEGKNEAFAKSCNEQGYYVHNIPFSRAGSFKNIAYVSELKKFLRKEQFDIVHAHTETGGLLLRLASSAKGSSRFIYTAHGMSFWKGCPLKNRLIYKTIEWWICRGMDMNLGMNQEEVDVLRKWNSKTAAYVHGIGLNLERFQNGIDFQGLTLYTQHEVKASSLDELFKIVDKTAFPLLTDEGTLNGRYSDTRIAGSCYVSLVRIIRQGKFEGDTCYQMSVSTQATPHESVEIGDVDSLGGLLVDMFENAKNETTRCFN